MLESIGGEYAGDGGVCYLAVNPRLDGPHVEDAGQQQEQHRLRALAHNLQLIHLQQQIQLFPRLHPLSLCGHDSGLFYWYFIRIVEDQF